MELQYIRDSLVCLSLIMMNSVLSGSSGTIKGNSRY